jgi:glycosyltransferase involved in cell wall biosynthesis
MSMARPVITTRVPGCRETVEEGANGWLIEARDPDALAEAMLRMLSDRARMQKMAERSRRIAEERFGELQINRQLLAEIFAGEPVPCHT